MHAKAGFGFSLFYSAADFQNLLNIIMQLTHPSGGNSPDHRLLL
jgi:hypothetical protein